MHKTYVRFTRDDEMKGRHASATNDCVKRGGHFPALLIALQRSPHPSSYIETRNKGVLHCFSRLSSTAPIFASHLPPLNLPVSGRGNQDKDTAGVEGHVSSHHASVDLGRRAGFGRNGRRQRHDNEHVEHGGPEAKKNCGPIPAEAYS